MVCVMEETKKEIMAEFEEIKKLILYKDIADNKYYLEDYIGNRVEIPTKVLSIRISNALNKFNIESKEEPKKDIDLGPIENTDEVAAEDLFETSIVEIPPIEIPKKEESDEVADGVFFETSIVEISEKEKVEEPDENKEYAKEVISAIKKVCSICKTNEATHKGGLCNKCYHKEYYKNPPKKVSPKQKQQKEQTELDTLLAQKKGSNICVCGVNSTNHVGLCTKCAIRKKYLLKKKLKVQAQDQQPHKKKTVEELLNSI